MCPIIHKEKLLFVYQQENALQLLMKKRIFPVDSKVVSNISDYVDRTGVDFRRIY
jgi:hypothetical protein